ncbi:MAG: 4a-hydroxytetrahydrobiopterin dehydratase [Flavobacteriaceae bacterium]|tara:strand:+ start:138 stop:374 length:237 start_codon:yes stop_codon:yes gene_type:complete
MFNDWKKESGKLIKSFKFNDFKEALEFINDVGQIAESLNHHPKIINVYNSVEIQLWTHDQNSITDLDYNLAREIDKLK